MKVSEEYTPINRDELRIIREYQSLMGYAQDNPMLDILTAYSLRAARRMDSRVNRGAHLINWMMICDEDDDFESFYGPNYFDL